MGNSEFINCVSVSNMRESDRKTIERHVPGLTLMYRAAMGVFLSADWNGKTVIAAGSGNNGGDGFALSCILKEHGFDCRVATGGLQTALTLKSKQRYWAFQSRLMRADVFPAVIS